MKHLFMSLIMIMSMQYYAAYGQSENSPKTFRLYNAALHDSIRIRHTFTSDTTAVFRLEAADNKWLSTAYEFQTSVLWEGVPVDFKAKMTGNMLCIRYSFLGNKILGNIFYFTRRKSGYCFIKEAEFQELNTGKDQVCILSVDIKFKNNIATVKGIEGPAKCITMQRW